MGEFGLRENLYYGSIFLCMTLIVIVCFLVINNRTSGDAGTASAMFDGGECLPTFSILGRQLVGKVL